MLFTLDDVCVFIMFIESVKNPKLICITEIYAIPIHRNDLTVILCKKRETRTTSTTTTTEHQVPDLI